MVETQADAPTSRAFDDKSRWLFQVDDDRGSGGLVDEVDAANPAGNPQRDRARTGDRLGRIRCGRHTHDDRFLLLGNRSGRCGDRKSGRCCRCSRIGQRGRLRESLDFGCKHIPGRLQLDSLLLQFGTLLLDASPVGTCLRQAGLLGRTGRLGLLQPLFLFATAAHLFLAAVFFCTTRGHCQGEFLA